MDSQQFGELFSGGEFDGLFVGYFLDPNLAELLALDIPGAIVRDQLHVTVCYAGKVAELADTDVMQAITYARDAIRYSRTFAGTVNGLGRFLGTGEGTDTVVALVDIPGLSVLNNDLAGIFERAGLDRSEHGFTAHISLAVIPSGEAMPEIESLPLAIAITSLTINAGTFSEVIPLGAGFEAAIFGEVRDKDGNADIQAARLFIPQRYAEPPEWINYLPVPGEYTHKTLGEVVFTPERNQRFVDQFEARIYGQDLPIDAEHQLGWSGAMGYVREMKVNEQGGVDARVDWSDRGRKLIEGNRYNYFSPEIWPEWPDPVTGVLHKDIAVGGALTTRPFYKESSLKPIAASEEKPNKETRMPDSPPTTANTDGVPTPQQFAEMSQKYAEVMAKNAALEASNQERDARVAAMEKSMRAQRFSEEVEGRSQESKVAWFGDAEKHTQFMQDLADKFGEESEQMTYYRTTMRDMTGRISASAFSEMGARIALVPTSANPAADFEAKVQKFTEENPGKNRAAAVVAVTQANPELAKQVRVTNSRQKGA